MAREVEQKKQERLQALQDSGVDVSQVPVEELEKEGPYLKWHRALRSDRARGNDQRADAREALLSRVLTWRMDLATRLGMAPAAVLSEAIARNVCLVMACEPAALEAAGVRVRGGKEELSAIMTAAVRELGLSYDVEEEADGSGGLGACSAGTFSAASMVLPAPGQLFCSAQPALAGQLEASLDRLSSVVPSAKGPKPYKKKSWESSWEFFHGPAGTDGRGAGRGNLQVSLFIFLFIFS
jgi:hypothetical protein